MPNDQTLVVSSYNIHRCVGIDRRWNPARTARVLAELQSDILALQEVDNQPDGTEEAMQLDYLAKIMQMTVVPGLRAVHRTGEYGNAILTRFPVLRSCLHDLSHSRYEPRCVIDATLDYYGTEIRILAAHLGLNRAERRIQMGKLRTLLEATSPFVPTILVGDMNEWYRRSASLRPIHELLGEPPSPPAFPSFAPFLALTRLWIRPLEALRSLTTHFSPLARQASDHLPVKATIDPQKLHLLAKCS